MDVVLVTCTKHLAPADDREFLVPALAERGLHAQHIAWDDPVMDWSLPRLAVIRATWDYHLRLPEFLAWAERVAALIPLWNPIEIVRWNTHKSYLRDLHQRGVPIIPTLWLPQGTSVDLASLLEDQGWQHAVIKPAVSASSYATLLVSNASLIQGQAHLAQFLPTRDMLVQPFLSSITTYGERSFIFIDGELTHAVRRRPSLALAQATEERSKLVEPTSDEAAFARKVLQATGYRILYARVDLVRDDGGDICLMELELVEPGLILSEAPWAAQRFADAIVRYASEHV